MGRDILSSFLKRVPYEGCSLPCSFSSLLFLSALQWFELLNVPSSFTPLKTCGPRTDINRWNKRCVGWVQFFVMKQQSSCFPRLWLWRWLWSLLLVPSHVSCKSSWNLYSFAAIRTDGSVYSWGSEWFGANQGLSGQYLVSDVISIYSTEYAFLALKSTGDVVAWGGNGNGGDASHVNITHPVIFVSATSAAFAVIMSNGAVIAWGDRNSGGNTTLVANQLQSNVVKIYSNYFAFAAVKSDGSVVTWGDPARGGDCSSVSSKLTSGVIEIYGTDAAFAALKSDGSVVTWGSSAGGGDSSSVASLLLKDIVIVYSNKDSFAAVPTVESKKYVVTWGGYDHGGQNVPQAVKAQLYQILFIAATDEAFAAVNINNAVITWGASNKGGDSTAVASQIASDVVTISATKSAFAAIKKNGQVITWGASNPGGNSASVRSQISSGVVEVVGNNAAFAALKADGTVVTWGSATSGGDSSAVKSQLVDVISISRTGTAFCALRYDGTVVTWGDTANGGTGGPPGYVTYVSTYERPNTIIQLSSIPTSSPTIRPSVSPTIQPTSPTHQPSFSPSFAPTSPTSIPTGEPTSPTSIPTSQPTSPTSQPTQRKKAAGEGAGIWSPSSGSFWGILIAIIFVAGSLVGLVYWKSTSGTFALSKDQVAQYYPANTHATRGAAGDVEDALPEKRVEVSEGIEFVVPNTTNGYNPLHPNNGRGRVSFPLLLHLNFFSSRYFPTERPQ